MKELIKNMTRCSKNWRINNVLYTEEENQFISEQKNLIKIGTMTHTVMVHSERKIMIKYYIGLIWSLAFLGGFFSGQSLVFAADMTIDMLNKDANGNKMVYFKRSDKYCESCSWRNDYLVACIKRT